MVEATLSDGIPTIVVSSHRTVLHSLAVNLNRPELRLGFVGCKGGSSTHRLILLQKSDRYCWISRWDVVVSRM